jgi:hypothetical protein
MRCSKCGETEKYYKLQPVYGYITNVYNADGTYAKDQRETHDNILYRQENKICYCASCHKKLTKKELEMN